MEGWHYRLLCRHPTLAHGNEVGLHHNSCAPTPLLPAPPWLSFIDTHLEGKRWKLVFVNHPDKGTNLTKISLVPYDFMDDPLVNGAKCQALCSALCRSLHYNSVEWELLSLFFVCKNIWERFGSVKWLFMILLPGLSPFTVLPFSNHPRAWVYTSVVSKWIYK